MRPALTIGLTNPRSAIARSPHYMATSEELAPIRDGAWAVWAQRNPASGASLASDFVCRLPDGSLGVVVAVFDDGGWRLACQTA